MTRCITGDMCIVQTTEFLTYLRYIHQTLVCVYESTNVHLFARPILTLISPT